ncbi:diguanylate cyclase [Desulfosarcina ovata]|uniref:diguanylate cyclase n=2 Tax=Desulfosarcina ovata TaxID=83564 RepID=A0A5K8A5M5_9BACT|nr:diguanylate cyclase [Desulfosarcina ovata]BBO80541.1 diguanylate cyclase response regulator [Desulfosarcina ovata subsp. sediminis]BBO87751.1 diguanylate cyclase response regulator [Desulfosarcina ovata subsp. ovata]
MTAHILIVDDEPSIRETMREYLRLSGYETSVASSAEEALAAITACPMEVVITDIMLPGIDGLALTDQIKASWDVDVIVMTGYSQEYSYEEAISKGASDFVFKPVRFEELDLRLKRVLRERLLNQERLQMLDELKKLSITDGLTQLYNSRYFYSQLKGEIERFNRYGHKLSLLLLDIDNFKIYNDTFGHLEGDKILVRIGQIIRACLRKMDTAYRYGGEEFTIILPGTPGEEARTVAERLRTAVASETFSSAGNATVQITISVGVTQYCREEPVSGFVQRADQAMYESKQAGRNRVSCIFKPPAE